MSRFRHIAIEGSIGVGKTTLARRLAAHFGAELLLEQAGENPYLERFYQDPAGYAFQTQVFFLFQRARQVAALAQPGMFTPDIVSDFFFEKDAIFARLNLGDEEFGLYRQMYAQVETRVPKPDLVIWLQAPVPTLLDRIRRRGIAMEQRIDEGYITRLVDAYAVHFDSYTQAPVLAVQTEHFHPGGQDADLRVLLDKLESMTGSRDFLGPPESPRLT